MKTKKIVLGFILIALFGSCQKKYKCQSYNSEVITETVSITDFNKINLEMDADIYFTQGNEQSVIVEAPEKLLEHISTTVFQNTLTIDFDNHFCYTNKKTVKIYIVSPNLEEIDIEGSGDIKVENLLNSDNFKIKISGSGDFYADSMAVNIFNAEISGSGEVYAASMDTINKQTIKISGSGDVDLLAMPCLETSISISGSGDCKVNSIDQLDVKISGSGDVRYLGSPIINSSISGSGSVKQF